MSTPLTASQWPTLFFRSRQSSARPIDGSDKNPKCRRTGPIANVFVIALFAGLLSACATDDSAIVEEDPEVDAKVGEMDKNPDGAGDRYAKLDGLEDLNFGQDWTNDADGLNALDFGHVPGGKANLRSGDRAGGNTGGHARTAPKSAGPKQGTWTVVLKTFSHVSHASAAATMVAELPKIDATFNGQAHVVTTEDGSMVCFGRFQGPRDENAQQALTWVKDLKIQNRKVFPSAMLTRAANEPRQSDNPASLAYVRRKMPDADPLYTLDVAIWIAENERDSERDQIRAAAEGYCQELRARNVQAFFHHDDAKGMSMVTVGLFDHRDLDHESGLLSARVEETMQKFPIRKVNGEQFNEPIDPHRLEMGTRPQRPRLVLVP